MNIETGFIKSGQSKEGFVQYLNFRFLISTDGNIDIDCQTKKNNGKGEFQISHFTSVYKNHDGNPVPSLFVPFIQTIIPHTEKKCWGNFMTKSMWEKFVIQPIIYIKEELSLEFLAHEKKIKELENYILKKEGDFRKENESAINDPNSYWNFIQRIPPLWNFY